MRGFHRKETRLAETALRFTWQSASYYPTIVVQIVGRPDAAVTRFVCEIFHASFHKAQEAGQAWQSAAP
jgi:hypothetical protein